MVRRNLSRFVGEDEDPLELNRSRLTAEIDRYDDIPASVEDDGNLKEQRPESRHPGNRRKNRQTIPKKTKRSVERSKRSQITTNETETRSSVSEELLYQGY